MAKFLQHNVKRSAEMLHSLLETAKERNVDLVLVQEPPGCRPSHPAYDFLSSKGRALSARRVGSDWTFSTEDAFTRDAEGDTQAPAMGRRSERGRSVRVVNACF